MWQRNTWVVTTQINTKHNITEFYVAFTNRLIVIVVIAIITELTFIGFSNFSFSWDERNVELSALLPLPGERVQYTIN